MTEAPYQLKEEKERIKMVKLENKINLFNKDLTVILAPLKRLMLSFWIIFIIFFSIPLLFSQTPKDNAIINQMWYQRNINILFSPVRYLYADDAFSNIPGGENAKYTITHLLHEIGEYSFIMTDDSTTLHNLELGFEWAFNNHFSIIASGKTVLSEYEKNKAWYFLGGVGFALNDSFSGKIIGGILNANSPVYSEENYSSFNMRNIGMSLNLFNILSVRGQYEYYTIELNDETIFVESGIYFRDEDSSGLNYLAMGFEFLKLLGIPLTSSIEYFHLDKIKQLNIGISLSSILYSYRPDTFDIFADLNFIGKDWNMFKNIDLSLTLFLPLFPIFGYEGIDYTRQPLKNGYTIFSRYGFSIMGSYRADNEDLPGNKIVGFGGAIGYGATWYTLDKKQRITSIYNQNYVRVFYHYSPDTYNAPNYNWGIRFGYRL